jgi:SecD/SecF fusion protein
MLRRLIVLGVVALTTLLLMFVNSKVLVGEQELQAQLQLVSKPEAPERTWKVTFTDLGGNGVLATAHEQKLVTTRLAGSERIAKIPVKSVSPVTPDHAIEITGGPEVSETDLKRRLQGVPFKRPNEPKSLLHVNPGIDLRGGVEFVCQLRNELGARVAADDEVMHVLRGRLDERGLTEPVVTKLSNGDVSVVIPGGTRADAARTRKVLEDTGRLEFREVLEDYDNVVLGQPGAKVEALPNGGWRFAPDTYHGRGDIVAPERIEPGFTPRKFYRLGKAELTGKDVADANQALDQGQQVVTIAFTAAGATKNEQFTTRLFNTGPEHGNRSGTGRLAILFDGVVQSDPVVQSPSKAHCQISGKFTQDDIDRLRTSLKAGSLSVIPEVISERVVGATLGAETVSRALLAMIASFLAIVAFMALYYRRLGTVANLCLVVTSFLIFATLSLFNATVTLPGLAGLVLSIGMAVDTNILVFERIREELAKDKGLAYAIEHGYGRAFLTIVDAHLTTFVTALILYYIGSGPVKGFGLTLMIGIAVNLFSGIYVGRMFTDWLCRGRDTLTMATWVPALRLPYVEWRHWGYGFSFITGIVGAGWFLFGHKLAGGSFERNFDIDFTGGNMVQVIFKEPKALNEVESKVHAALEALRAKGEKADLLDDLRMQPYVAALGDDGSRSRQWVFRGRDEEGSRLEAQRSAREEARGRAQRQADVLRAGDPPAVQPNEPEARKLDKQVEAIAHEIIELQASISARTDAFKKAIAQVFPGDVAAEGDEVLAAKFADKTLTLSLATLTPPDQEQADRLAKEMARRDELAAVTAKPLAGAVPGLELTATYRTSPSAVNTFDVSDPALTRLVTLIGGEMPNEIARGQARAAFDLVNAASTQAAKERLTVARPFPASEHFSGQVADQMKIRAGLATLLSLIAILAYVASRFELRFGIGAVIALFHDVVLTIGILCFMGIRIDLNVIAAILTIIGFSINDTIVTFDRVRENLPKLGKSLAETIDISIAQTMSRTVLTSGTVIATVIVLLVFGGDALRPFSATLLIGFTLGTYSSVFVAAPLLLTFSKPGGGAPPAGLPGADGAPTTAAVAPAAPAGA